MTALGFIASPVLSLGCQETNVFITAWSVSHAPPPPPPTPPLPINQHLVTSGGGAPPTRLRFYQFGSLRVSGLTARQAMDETHACVRSVKETIPTTPTVVRLTHLQLLIRRVNAPKPISLSRSLALLFYLSLSLSVSLSL